MRDGIRYECDEQDLTGKRICTCSAVFKSYKKARAASWCLAKDYKTCYCPAHAPAHQRGNAKNTNKKAHAALQRLVKIGLSN